MRPFTEKITPNLGSSFHIERYHTNMDCLTNNWHHHPEHELVYVKKGSGEIRVGNHLSYYEDGMMIFIGPDIPHLPFLNDSLSDNYEIVVQMTTDFMGKDFLDKSELFHVKRLFQQSVHGILFHESARLQAGDKLNQILHTSGLKKLTLLMEFLDELARNEAYDLINASGASLAVKPGDFNRINKVYAYIAEHYAEDVSLEKAANLAHMTLPAFCRHFKRMTGKTFTRFLNEYRITRSLNMLNKEDCPISQVAFACGYNSLSYFNRQFREITGHKPSDYKKVFRNVLA